MRGASRSSWRLVTGGAFVSPNAVGSLAADIDVEPMI